MKTHFKLFLSVLFLLNSYNSVADSIPSFAKKIASRFYTQATIAQQEKVYLQTDKPYYSAGENIWFKAYLVFAGNHIPMAMSQFVYVELIDKSSRVVTRVKIAQDSTGFSGYINLKPNLAAGNYVLRAYSAWMQNAGTDFFFKKNISIGNSIDNSVLATINFSTNKNQELPTNLTITNSNKYPYSNKTVAICQSWNNPKNTKSTYTTDKDGAINFPLIVDSLTDNNQFIDVALNDKDIQFTKRFYLPTISTDFDVQFFPESGTLLSNELQYISFKAIGTDGLSVEITGKIINNKGDVVTEFSSTNKGMGKFSLQPDSSVSYRAIVKSKVGIEKQYSLPKVQ